MKTPHVPRTAAMTARLAELSAASDALAKKGRSRSPGQLTLGTSSPALTTAPGREDTDQAARREEEEHAFPADVFTSRCKG